MQDLKPKAKAKAACKNPKQSPDKKSVQKPAEKPAETKPAAKKSQRKQQGAFSLTEKQAIQDKKKAERMKLAQDKADRMLVVVRESGLEDLQPAVGFTAKCHDCL